MIWKNSLYTKTSTPPKITLHAIFCKQKRVGSLFWMGLMRIQWAFESLFSTISHAPPPSIGVTPFWRKFLAVSGSPSSPLAPPVEVLRLFRKLCLSNDRCFPFRPRETKEKKAKCLRVGIYICSHLKRGYFKFQHTRLTLQVPTPQNGQTHSNNSSAIAIFFECVWPFCGVGAWRVKGNFFINPFRVRCFFLYH